MARQGITPTPQIELNPPQVATVKTAALTALKRAFQAYPARALLTVDTNDQRPSNKVEVSGGYYSQTAGQVNCGLTAYGRAASTAWYPCSLTQAQFALTLEDVDLSSATSSSSFVQVLLATGEGIGNTAAHEIAHQYLANTCGMNDDPRKTGVYDGGSADAGSDPSMYTGAGPNGQPLHWSGDTAKCLAQKLLTYK